MPRSRAFARVDVLSAEPLLGSPVTVILDARRHGRGEGGALGGAGEAYERFGLSLRRV